MHDSIDVVIPAINDYSNREDELRQYFQTMLHDLSVCFSDALDSDCDHRKSNAILERLAIDRVTVDGHTITIEYHVELSAFSACNLHTDHYSFRRTVVGSQHGNVWKFSKHKPLPERSSVDEF